MSGGFREGTRDWSESSYYAHSAAINLIEPV